VETPEIAADEILIHYIERSSVLFRKLGGIYAADSQVALRVDVKII
jgi:hypothetical protein